MVTFSTSRPVMDRAQIDRLMQQILGMTSAGTVAVRVENTKRIVTRFINNQIVMGDDGDSLQINLRTEFGGLGRVWMQTNQIDETSLRVAVQQCEEVARERIGEREAIIENFEYQDDYLPIALWHDSTAQAMTSGGYTIVPEMIEAAARENLKASGFVGLVARTQAVLTKAGVTAFYDETDTEVTVTVRTPDGKASGWAGHATRDWATVPYMDVVKKAIELCKMSVGARALEPGRRTAILEPAAVVQMARFFAAQFDAFSTDTGMTAFSKTDRGGNRLHQRVFDERINMFTDPADPLGGCPNFFGSYQEGLAVPKMQWVERGVLQNLAYDPSYAMQKGKAYSFRPASIHITGGTTTVPEMISMCDDGIYVNRLSSVEMIDKRTGMMTGATRDGCFLVKGGKIVMPVKNFQILESPFFFLNQIMALGAPQRAAFGNTPPTVDDSGYEWPRMPIIVPPMMVRDFNFLALVDAA